MGLSEADDDQIDGDGELPVDAEPTLVGVRRLELQEHRPCPGVPLTGDEVDALLASEARITVTPDSGRPGHYTLKPGSRVGLVAIGDLAIAIRPKVRTGRLLMMLSFDLGHVRLQDGAVDAGRHGDLTEAIIRIYCDLVHRALRRGVLQGYQTEEEALPGVRGRIRFDDQLRKRHGIAPPVEVRYDDFTEDIEANRLLKAALHALHRTVSRSGASPNLLRAAGRSLQRVSLVEYPANRIPEVPVDRLNAHYEPALLMAGLILRSTSVETLHGDVRVSSLLFDMNAVFESFIRGALAQGLFIDRREFPPPGEAPRLWLDRDRRVRLEPDLQWVIDGRTVFVGDAKYKRLAPSGFQHADVYQMLAYLTATGLDEGLLVYAQGEAEDHHHELEKAGKAVRVHSIDLSAEGPDWVHEVRRLVWVVREMAARTLRRDGGDVRRAGGRVMRSVR